MTPLIAVRWLRGFFAGARDVERPVFSRQRASFDRAVTMVSVFYVANLFFTFTHLQLWPGLARTRALDALWPVAWADSVGITPAVHAIMVLLLLGSVAAALMPGRRSARIAAFLGLFLFHALINSFGKINHAFHGWLLAALLFVLLPDGTRERIGATRLGRQRWLNGFWSAMAIQGLCYSLAGTWKVLGAIPQGLRGEMHSLAPEALGAHIAHRLLQTESESLLGAVFIENAWLGWPSFLFVLYVQVFALWSVFRPALHRVWGLGLISFHFMVFLTMGIVFEPPVLLMGILFLCSPFAPPFDLGQVLRTLPVVGGLAGRGLDLVAGRDPREREEAADGGLGAHGGGDLAAPRESLPSR